MPTNNYTTPGTYTWTAPQFTDQVIATVIGGGGAGFKDCDGDDEGGGGGGGAFGRRTASISQGTVLTIIVGRAGARQGCQTRNNSMVGGVSRIDGTGISVSAFGGGPGSDNDGGGGGGAANGDITNSGGGGQDDDNSGGGGGAGNLTGNSGRPGGRSGGYGTTLNGVRALGTNGGSLPNGRFGGNFGGGGAGNDGGDAGSGGSGAARIEWTYFTPVINSFSVTNNFNTDGVPDANISMSWDVDYATRVRVWRGAIGSANLIYDGSQLSRSLNDNTGLQSVAGSNSPAEITYFIRANGPGGQDNDNDTSQVTNDNTPNNYYVPSLTDVEPNTVYSLIPRDVATNGNVSGMDMNHFVTGGPGVEVSVNSGATWSTGSLLNTSGGTAGIRARVTSEPFNPDFTGQTNVSPTYSLTIGSVTRTFTISTRAPDVEETFNIPNYDDYVPNPDIDTIPDVDPAPENQSNLFIVSNTLDVDDIEIEVPIRTDNPDVQVRIKKNGASLFGAWQDITEIGT